MARSYLDFDLLVIPSAPHYAARVINSPAGQARAEFALPFEADELQRLRLQAGPTARHLERAVTNGDPSPLDAKAFGQRLYSAVFVGEVEQVFLRSLDAARSQEMGLRIRLRLNDVPELADLPWEFLYAPGLGRFLALSDETPVLRYVELAQEERALGVEPPLRILVVVSNPQDVDPLAVEEEWLRLQQALTGLGAQAHVTRLAEPTLDALQTALRRSDVHVLHFIGHGIFDAGRNQGALVFEDGMRRSHVVAAELLATLLHDHPPLRLVFLNACEGARGGPTSAFAGVAQQLVQQRIPAVLAMQFPVGDAAAIALAHGFYAAVADGATLDEAIGETRKALYAAGHTFEWGTPVLFSRTPGSALVDLETETELPMREQPATPWWDQIQAGGDVIIATIGAGASNVAVGKGITQQIYQLVGPPAPDDKQIVEQKLDELSALLAGQAATGDAAKQQIAALQLQLLRGELTKTEQADTPSAAAISLAGNWLLDNVPTLVEAVTGLFATPAVGRVLGRAGEAAVTWARERFGSR